MTKNIILWWVAISCQPLSRNLWFRKILKLHSNLCNLRKVPEKLDYSEGELSVHHVLVPLRLCHPVPHHLQYEHSEPFTGHHLLDLQRCLFHLHASLPWSRGPMAKGGPKALLWCKIIYRVVFCNCSAQISVLKRKTLFNQRGSILHREFHGTKSLIGCPSFFILVLKNGRNS